MPREFEMPLTVRPEHIDRMDHVNNVAFVKMVQDVATAHWLSLASAEVLRDFTWVCRRHEIDYLKPGVLDDDLLVKTRVGEPTGATWERFTEIVRTRDGVMLVQARTVWVLLDVTTGRPRRIDGAIRAVLS
jgi:acyl-CoA thioester hydrolase